MATVMQTKIKDIEDEMARTQKNKRQPRPSWTFESPSSRANSENSLGASKGAGGAGEGFDVTSRSGDSRGFSRVSVGQVHSSRQTDWILSLGGFMSLRP
ncbi:hypothetical protein R1flu_005236 [Riccia fluitans]|uniref:Uncharacterized protein n=1 Tax=Riccia fluitans TaxID=41844 RepID=A0ABD1YWK4_9MARC